MDTTNAEFAKLLKDMNAKEEMKLKPIPEQTKRKPPKVGRNETCPCGSNKKFKYCCLEKK